MKDIYADLIDNETIDVIRNRFENYLRYKQFKLKCSSQVRSNINEMLVEELEGLFSKIKELSNDIENMVENSTHFSDFFCQSSNTNTTRKGKRL